MNISFERIKSRLIKENLNFNKKFFDLKMKLTGNTRPHSYPRISCDTFRWLSDHVYDEIDKNTKIVNIKKGDIIFVSSFFIDEFFKFIHPKLKNKYVLITHTGIEAIDGKSMKYIDDKIIHWFGKNVLINHPKITPIPIGLENLWKYGTGIISLFDRLNKIKIKEKKNNILYHFKIATNKKERQKAYDYIIKHSLAETFEHKQCPPIYLKKLIQYKFILSPPGAGEECHRTWEALYLDVVPIVKKCAATQYFQSLGLPIWNVEEWSDLDNINQEFLNQKYNELNKTNKKAIFMDFWIHKISEKSNKSYNELRSKFN